ncbi:hypothetical protein TcasGA2_TC001645 [Tribolium castaneum]|uniref:Reverse transcriptase domain-containing protein n=1 Tax=Tribolium castaneum TaxID=7070 RepID=D6X1N3_TRICA|nr:hypothetical protein TcasGA2_TC001645 [Tribolium castaneum]
MEFLIMNLLPDDDPDGNTEEQRATQSDFRTTTAEVGSDVVITEEEVDNFVSQIQKKKAPGLDNLKEKILKKLHPKITPFITPIYNACWIQNYFLTTWKKENLVVLLKDPKASHANIKNYRPITLLPEHEKIFEKTIRRKLEEELSPLHSQRQFGFVTGRSTSNALHSLVSTIQFKTRLTHRVQYINERVAHEDDKAGRKPIRYIPAPAPKTNAWTRAPTMQPLPVPPTTASHWPALSQRYPHQQQEPPRAPQPQEPPKPQGTMTTAETLVQLSQACKRLDQLVDC